MTLIVAGTLVVVVTSLVVLGVALLNVGARADWLMDLERNVPRPGERALQIGEELEASSRAAGSRRG